MSADQPRPGGPLVLRILVSGRVQGVGYRAWCAATARQAGLSGFVRNRMSGEVEAVFAGPESDVRTMVEACRSGPRHARVERVEVVADAEGRDPAVAILGESGTGATFLVLETV